MPGLGVGKRIDRTTLALRELAWLDGGARAVGGDDPVMHGTGGVLQGRDVSDEGRPGLECVLECLERVAELLRGDSQLMDVGGVRGLRVDLVRENRPERLPDQAGSLRRN